MFRSPHLACAALLGCQLLAARVDAAVSQPHPGMTLVTQSGRATLVTNLCAPGVEVRATRYDERKRTARGFGELLGLQAAINADFFDFPNATLVIGRAMGDGQWWPAGHAWIQEQDRPYWQFGPRLAEGVSPGFVEPSPAARNIVGGHNVIIDNGASTAPWVGDAPLLYGTHRRTGMGISADRRTLYMTVVNTAITGEQLVAYMMADASAANAPPIDFATNMDGGGSSQMWVQSTGWVVSSSRLVANHVGVWASGSGDAPQCRPRYSARLDGSSFPLSVSGFGSEGTVQIEQGETVTGTVTFTNVADATWTADTKLAPTPRDASHPLAAADWISPSRISAAPHDVAPLTSVDFPVSIHGAEAGSYRLPLTVVQELVTWFGDGPLGGGPIDDVVWIEVEVLPAAPDDPGDGGGGGDEGEHRPGDGAVGAGGGLDIATRGDEDEDLGLHGQCACRLRGGPGPSPKLVWWWLLGALALARRSRSRLLAGC